MLFLLSAASDCKKPPLDIALVIDRTKSVGIDNYKTMMDSVRLLISKFNVGPENDHIAILTFAGRTQVRAHLGDSKFHSVRGLSELISTMKTHDVLGSSTRTDIALDTVNKLVFTPENGDRPDSPDILIVFTDGGKHPDSAPYSAVLPPLEVRQSESSEA